MKGLSKGVDPSAAAEELQRITNIYGKITPEIIVNESKDPESILYPIFEWDDDKAAYNYRLQQARILLNNIQVNVITDGESRNISVYEVTSFKEGYKSIDSFTHDDIEYVKAGIVSELNYLKGKLKLYKEFEKVLVYIEQAIAVMD
jgi:hypothetical protein